MKKIFNFVIILGMIMCACSAIGISSTISTFENNGIKIYTIDIPRYISNIVALKPYLINIINNRITTNPYNIQSNNVINIVIAFLNTIIAIFNMVMIPITYGISIIPIVLTLLGMETTNNPILMLFEKSNYLQIPYIPYTEGGINWIIPHFNIL